jgi:hypothetical protein
MVLRSDSANRLSVADFLRHRLGLTGTHLQQLDQHPADALRFTG